MDEFSKPQIGTVTRPATCDTHGEYESKAMQMGGKTYPWSGCPTCNDIARAAEQAKAEQAEAEAKQRRMEARLNMAGIPQRYRAKDFASFVVESEGQDRARATAMQFAHNFKEHRARGTFMVFSGPPGTGKTHLAIAIAQHMMQHGTALYTSAIDAVRMIRDTWRRGADKTETEVLQTLAGIDLLILDEVGVQYGTEAEQVSLFDIIDKRYRDLMPTILLTNQNKAGMKQFLGDRSFDRLRENGLWVTFDWQSQRGSVAA